MGVVVITIKTSNAAFEENLTGEVARILRQYANNVGNQNAVYSTPLKDINGNTVGKVRYYEGMEEEQTT